MISLFQQHEWVSALCWTLLHSIWQGLLIALLAGILLMFTRKRSACVRYNLLSGLFLVFLVAMVITYIAQMNKTEVDIQTSSTESIGEPGGAVLGIEWVEGSNFVANSLPWLNGLVNFIDKNITLIFLLWMMFFILRMVKLIGGLAYVQRVKSRNIFIPPAAWQTRFEELQQKLYIRNAVRLFESGTIKVPVVLGLFKPVVLVPVGMFNGLPANEVEAILLHELAHIKRADYFVNMLQQFVETALFFNPAILWLSNVIREERENCCDDLAIGVTNNKIEFVNALVSFQEYATSLTDVQLALVSRKYPLLNRVQRIISSKSSSLNLVEKCIFSVGFCLFVLLSFVMGGDVQQSIPEQQQTAYQQHSDTLVKPVLPTRESSKSKDSTTIVHDKKAATKTVETVVSSGVSTVATANINGVSASAVATVNGGALAVSTSPNVSYHFEMPPNSPAVVVSSVSSDGQAKKDKKDTDIISMSKSISNDNGNKLAQLSVTFRNGQEYILKKENGDIKELIINGKRIESGTYAQYGKEIDQLEQLLNGN